MAKKQKNYQKINPVLRWLMVLSLMVIFFTLLVSWLLWLLRYRNTIEAMLVNFSFMNFSIITLIFSGLAILFGLSLIGLAKKNAVSNVFSLLSFVLALTLASVSLLLYHNLKINNFLVVVVVIPWIITIVATTCLFVSSGINLIVVKENFSEIEEMSMATAITLPATNQIENNIEVMNDNTKINNLEKADINFNELPIIKEQAQIQSKTPVVPVKEKSIVLKTKWTKKQIKEVWEKADIIPGVNQDLYRKDYAGAWMFFSAFMTNAEEVNLDIRSYSWTITPHKPTSRAGITDLENLIPMNFINAVTKGQNYPKWKTKISSWGNENIIKEQIWSD